MVKEDQENLEDHYFDLYIDGASKGNRGPSGIGIVLTHKESKFCLKKYIGVRTNNEAEYLALIEGLKLAMEKGVKRLRVYSDSELLIKQLKGEYAVRAPNLLKLYKEVKELERNFSEVIYSIIPREANKLADRLANEAVKTR